MNYLVLIPGPLAHVWWVWMSSLSSRRPLVTPWARLQSLQVRLGCQHGIALRSRWSFPHAPCDHAGRSATPSGQHWRRIWPHSDMNWRRTADQENLAVDLRPSEGPDMSCSAGHANPEIIPTVGFQCFDRPTVGGRPDSDGQVLPGRRTKKAAKKPISGWAGARNHGGAPAPARQLLFLRLQGLIASCSHRDRMTPTQPRSAVRVAQPQKLWRIHRRDRYVWLDGRGQSLSGTIQKGLRKCRLARLPWERG